MENSHKHENFRESELIYKILDNRKGEGWGTRFQK